MPLGESDNGGALSLGISMGAAGSVADRRRLRGLLGLRKLETSPTVERGGAEMVESVTEAATRPVVVSGVDAVTVVSAIYSE